jgi:hypothetical protein
MAWSTARVEMGLVMFLRRHLSSLFLLIARTSLGIHLISMVLVLALLFIFLPGWAVLFLSVLSNRINTGAVSFFCTHPAVLHGFAALPAVRIPVILLGTVLAVHFSKFQWIAVLTTAF